MNIALYSRSCSEKDLDFISYVIHFLKDNGVSVWVFHTLKEFLSATDLQCLSGEFQHTQALIGTRADFLFSIGGDGTFIDAANLVDTANIPIVGINTGRIGFLTNVNRNNFCNAFQLIQQSDYQIEKRFLLEIEIDTAATLPTHFALNDISIHPHGESINSVFVAANGTPLNTYWGDGIIVATPTGSTAYSLSCGGPIIVPAADVITLTPIASHSLTVRPIVLPADNELKIKVESRSHRFVLSIDSHRLEMDDSVTITLRRANFTIPTIRFHKADFFSVIREKLLWGIDRRNLTDYES